MITKSIKHFFAVCLVSCNIVAALTACSDILESDSSRQVFDPELSQKTDSIYYALGVLQAMQELADHYVFQGEVRGELVDTTHYTDTNLRQLADFSATTTNRYDSAYVYYRVINNCNYYIAHRDTTLRTGATYVTRNEYAAIKAIRAWAYMQLARVYGRVPFYTEPLTQISQIDDNQYPELTMSEIVARLAPDLEQYSGLPVPDFGGTFPPNSFIVARKLFIPVDIVLGDMYLESGQYAPAAQHYITYLTKVATQNHTAFTENYRRSLFRYSGAEDTDLPTDYDVSANERISSQRWSSNIFLTVTTGYNDVITYIPLAPKSSQGKTTLVSQTFGYDLYSTGSSMLVDEIQLTPSQAYIDLSDNSYFYYISRFSTSTQTIINMAQIGDFRYNGSVNEEREGDEETGTVTRRVNKYLMGNIYLYRNTTVLLHLAEAFNRLGMYDAAFAILKDGINPILIDTSLGGPAYISDETKQLLQTTYPLLSQANMSKFEGSNAYYGVHTHGAGYTRDYNGAVYQPQLSPYQLDTVVTVKMADIAADFGVSVGTTRADTINAVEDLLCDEYALEFAFEGTRFYDLCRLARHKNAASPYGANFGSQWLARKYQLAGKAVTKDLTNPENWYLPFK